MSIEVEHGDPRTAREIADTIAQKFVEYQQRSRLRVDNERIEYMKAQVAQVATEVQDLESKLYNSPSGRASCPRSGSAGLHQTPAPA